jgi:phosphatidylethanolamine-binding protein (PEBP) family uncharacterized protein
MYALRRLAKVEDLIQAVKQTRGMQSYNLLKGMRFFGDGVSGMRCATTALFLSMAAQGGFAMSFNLESNAFQNGGDIPQKFTCDGTDVSPPLVWGDAPSGTKSLALIADDPDAPGGTWVHWVMYDIEPQTVLLREGMAKTESIPGNWQTGA